MRSILSVVESPSSSVLEVYYTPEKVKTFLEKGRFQKESSNELHLIWVRLPLTLGFLLANKGLVCQHFFFSPLPTIILSGEAVGFLLSSKIYTNCIFWVNDHMPTFLELPKTKTYIYSWSISFSSHSW